VGPEVGRVWPIFFVHPRFDVDLRSFRRPRDRATRLTLLDEIYGIA
jgi:hypothetical protein